MPPHPRRRLSLVTLTLTLPLTLTGCSSKPAVPVATTTEGLRYGVVMSEIGRRFELLGKAARARRWELADYQLRELKEAVDDDLPRAAPPREPSAADLKALTRNFEAPLGELSAALLRRDPWAVAQSFDHTANACNNCHQSTGHAFIEVPSEPGEPVPRLSSLAAPDAGTTRPHSE